MKLATQVGVSKAKVAEELGIHDNVLTRWVREAQAGIVKLPLMSRTGYRGHESHVSR